MFSPRKSSLTALFGYIQLTFLFWLFLRRKNFWYVKRQRKSHLKNCVQSKSTYTSIFYLSHYPDRNFCLRVAPKPYQWHAYNEFIQKMSQRDPLKKIILSFFFCNSLVSRRYPWSVPFPFFGSLSTLRKIHDYPVIVLTRRNFPLPFKAGFTLRSLNG